MADSGMLYWEVEMDYIDDMLGTDDKSGDKVTDAEAHVEPQTAVPVTDEQSSDT